MRNLIVPNTVPIDSRALVDASPKDIQRLRSLGFMPIPAGGARGTNTSGDVLTQTVDGVSLNDLWNEYQASLEYWNQRRQALVDLLTFSVTQPIEKVGIPGGEEDFERASEFGEPVGIRTKMAYQFLGYDFAWYDLAIRYTWMFLAESQADQVNALNGAAMAADNRLVFRKVMESVFRNVTRNGMVQDREVTVYPFYNGDGWVPPRFKNYTYDGTETHYLTSGAATLGYEDVDVMIAKLRNKGYGDTPGAAQIMILANDAEIAQMKPWRIRDGASYDFVPPSDTSFPRFLVPADEQQNGGPPSQVAGFEVAGQYGPALVLRESYIPSGYVFAFATGGTNMSDNPIGIREHINTGLRGLRLVKGRDSDYPLIDSFYQRGFGTGVRHRGNGVVMQVTANATYTVPAEYADVA